MIPHMLGGSGNGTGGKGTSIDIGALDSDSDLEALPGEPDQESLPEPIAGSEAEVEEARPDGQRPSYNE